MFEWYFIDNSIPSENPPYLSSLERIFDCASDILFYIGKKPIIRQVTRETTNQENGARSTVSIYGNIVLKWFDYIVNGFKRTANGIKMYLLKVWQMDIKPLLKHFISRMSIRNSAVVMLYTGLGFEKMNKLNNIIYSIYGFKIFQPNNVVSDLFNSYNPIYDNFIHVRVKPSVNKNKTDKTKFTLSSSKGKLTIMVYKFDITLAVPMNADGWINNNLFVVNKWLTPYKNQLLTLFCSDRCDIDGMGCYAFSTVINCGAKASHSTHATTSMVIYGSWKDDYKSMTHVYTKTGYSDQLTVMNQLPVLFSFVKHNLSEGSRLVTSCVLAFDKTTQCQLNAQKTNDLKKLQDEWKKNNPPKTIPHTESVTTEGTDYVRWTARPRNTLGLGVVTPTRDSKRNKQHKQYHWKYAFNEFRNFLTEYIGKPYLLVVKGFYKEVANINSNIVNIIDDMIKRCLKNEQSDLPYVNDFSFNQGMFLSSERFDYTLNVNTCLFF